ncbi:Calmodulin [Hexamita inflata]|uniref:Calmodulin n=1 Tax=Hexamita inflata TaxID=28002 RepID=A0AA86TT73_9EUKA|nr:Calmodulin [Hexamita inflata]CAI9931385.1 Calmodulin [Hexamita inflata]
MAEFELSIKEAFAECDSSIDRTIPKEQLGNVLDKLGYLPKPDILYKWQQQLETNNTGYIKFEDLKNFIISLEKEEVPDILIAEMKCFDKQYGKTTPAPKPGYLSVEQIQHMMTRVGNKMRKQDVDDLLSNLRIDQGYCRQEELLRLLAKK